MFTKGGSAMVDPVCIRGGKSVYIESSGSIVGV